MQRGIGPHSHILAILRRHRLIYYLDNIVDRRMLYEGRRIIVCTLIANSLCRLHELSSIFSSESANRFTFGRLIPYMNGRHLRSLQMLDCVILHGYFGLCNFAALGLIDEDNSIIAQVEPLIHLLLTLTEPPKLAVELSGQLHLIIMNGLLLLDLAQGVIQHDLFIVATKSLYEPGGVGAGPLILEVAVLLQGGCVLVVHKEFSGVYLEPMVGIQH